MYRDYFQLRERPFTQAPGQRFFMPNSGVAAAIGQLQHLLSARDAIAVLTGGPGVGKSALVEQAIEAAGERVAVARVDMRHAEPEELCPLALLALGESPEDPAPARAYHMLRQVMGRRAREGQRLVLSLDTAGLTAELARHLLRLVNLAGERNCQMNIVLQGPHTLHQQVDLPALIQLRQRVAFRYRVRPLTLPETDRYIRHQIEATGGDAARIVTSTVSAAVYCYVAGVPRLINTLMDAALSEACIAKVDQPDGNQIKRTAEQLGWKPLTPKQDSSSPAPRAANARPVPVRADTAAQTGRLRAIPAAAPAATVRLSPVPAAASGTRAAPPAPAPGPQRAEPRKPVVPPRPLVAMDATDTSATGMLRLQDLDERFAESVFGTDIEEAAAALRGKSPDAN